jgi:hypothetical protein
MRSLVVVGMVSVISLSCSDDDANTNGEGDGGGGDAPVSVSCSGDLCSDAIAYCEIAVPRNWGGWGEVGVQRCVDGLLENYNLCQYPKNVASCMTECAQETVASTGTKAEFDQCVMDKQCGDFGNCPT